MLKRVKIEPHNLHVEVKVKIGADNRVLAYISSVSEGLNDVPRINTSIDFNRGLKINLQRPFGFNKPPSYGYSMETRRTSVLLHNNGLIYTVENYWPRNNKDLIDPVLWGTDANFGIENSFKPWKWYYVDITYTYAFIDVDNDPTTLYSLQYILGYSISLSSADLRHDVHRKLYQNLEVTERKREVRVLDPIKVQQVGSNVDVFKPIREKIASQIWKAADRYLYNVCKPGIPFRIDPDPLTEKAQSARGTEWLTFKKLVMKDLYF